MYCVYMMMVDGGTEYLMEIKTLKNIIVTIYNAHEVAVTELQCFSNFRDLKLPGEIVEYDLSPGIRFGHNKSSIKLKFKKQNFSICLCFYNFIFYY